MSFVSVSKEAEVATITLNLEKVGWPTSFRGEGAICLQPAWGVPACSSTGGIAYFTSAGHGAPRAEKAIGTGEGWLTELSTAKLKELFVLRNEAVAR